MGGGIARAMWRARAALQQWRRVAGARRRSRHLQLILEVVVARFRRRCWLALEEQRRLSHDQLVAIFDRWWREAAINALHAAPLPFRFPRPRNMQ